MMTKKETKLREIRIKYLIWEESGDEYPKKPHNFSAQLALQQFRLQHLLDPPDGDLMSLFQEQYTDGNNILYVFTLRPPPHQQVKR